MENEIVVRTNSGEYVGGDTVYGSVYLNLRSNVSARSLKLFIRGYEKCEYEYSYVVSTGENEYETKAGKRSAEQHFLKEDHTMIEYPGGFQKGCFCFPFQHQLPHGLPGVFSTNRGSFRESPIEAVIHYTIGAKLCNPTPRPHLQSEVPLIVYDDLDCRNFHLTPKIEKAEGVVKTYFCLNRGSIKGTSSLDRSAYTSGDVIKAKIEILNESSVDVSGITVTVNQVIKLLGKDTEREEHDLTDHKSLEIIMRQSSHDGCPKGDTRTLDMEFDLKQKESRATLPPSTSGKLVKCLYFIDVEIHCPWSPDIEVHQPFIIKPPLNISWAQWTPPTWVNKCILGPVTAPLAVARDLLHSSSFAPIPGVGTNT